MVGEIRFADGTVLTRQQIADRAIPYTDFELSLSYDNYPVADVLTGTSEDDFLDGRGGNDTLAGGAGNDMLSGGDGDDVLIGGAGNDMLYGGAGTNVYRFARGFGHDTISTHEAGVDWIEFDESITAADISVERGVAERDPYGSESYDLYLRVAGSDDVIVLSGGQSAYAAQIAGLRFANGAILTYADLRAAAVATPGEDQTGVPADDILSGTGGDDTLFGRAGNDTLTAGAGNDILIGGEGADILEGGAGNDQLDGGAGADIYRFSAGFGNDTLRDSSETGVVNAVSFDETISASDLTVYHSLDDMQSLVLRRKGTDDSLTITGAYGSNSAGVDEVRFADGTVWTRADLIAAAQPLPGLTLNGDGTDGTLLGASSDDMLFGSEGNETLSGEAGNDILQGGSGDDVLIGGAGSDTLDGGEGGDIYRFSAGFGSDIVFVSASGSEDSDTLEFDASIDANQVHLSALNGDYYGSVLLTINGSEDRIELRSLDLYDKIRFADGTTWTYDDIMARVEPSQGVYLNGDAGSEILGTSGWDRLSAIANVDTRLVGYAGDDILRGADGNDVLEGGSGDDILEGGMGSDTYRFSAGFGQDRINEWQNEGDITHVEFDGTIASDEIIVGSYGSPGDDFLQFFLRVAGTDDRITFQGGFGTSAFDVRFADGTVWSASDVLDRLVFLKGAELNGDQGGVPLIGGATSDYITGGIADERLEGLGGNDILDGGAGADILAGGAGNDQLRGGDGSDVYRFSRGDGEDRISDSVDGKNVIEFDATIDPAIVLVLTDNANLAGNYYLSIVGSEDRIWVERAEHDAVISEVRFADGTVWTSADIEARLRASSLPSITSAASGAQLSGTAGSDLLIGTAGADVIDGNGGLQWRGVGDNLVVNGSFETFATDAVQQSWGYSATSLPGWMRVDNTQAASTLAFEHAKSGTSSVNATDGTYWLDLDGTRTGGNDSNLHIAQDISGLAAGETMLIEFDHANRTSAASGPFEVLWNGSVVASFSNTGTTMVHSNVLVTAQAGANRLSFRGTGSQDGTGASLDNVSLKRAESYASAALGDDVLSGLDGDDLIRGGAGDDIVSGGAGADTLYGNAGNDTISGDAGNDILIGGTGGDLLAGGAGDDIYRFAAGDGQDTITDASGVDRIEFGAGISAADVKVSLVGDTSTLQLTFRDSDDRITITKGSATDGSAIESVSFADGTVWSFADLAARWQTPTAGDDIIIGTPPIETLAGGAGNDRIFASGSGDTLLGEAGNDILTGSSGSDILIGGAGDDTLTGADGADVLAGGTGADSLAGGLGDDVYRWGRGDGADTLTDTGGVDRVELAAGLLPDDIQVVAQDATNLILRIRDTGEELKLVNVLSSAANAVESVVFADGTVWAAADLRARSLLGTSADETLAGTTANERLEGRGGNDRLSGFDGDDVLLGGAGDDTLDGGRGDDQLVGGTGSDMLTGGSGADTYIFGIGDGVDTITDAGNSSTDTLRIEGYALAQIRFGVLGDDLIIRFSGSADRIIVHGGLANSVSDRVENFEIAADGVTLSLADVQARLVDDVAVTGAWLVGGATDDTLTGGTGDDYLKGGEGSDVLIGGAGNDHFADLSSDGSVDTLTGGEGRDIYYFLPVQPGMTPVVADIITDFQVGEGGDIIRLMSSNPNPFEGGALFLSQSGSDTLVMLRGTTGADQVVLRLAGIDATTLVSANFDGVPIAIDNSVNINDSDAGSTLIGSALDDRIFGNGGNDLINGYAGNDRLAGGADDDTIDGGFGNDLIAGGEGADRLIGGAGSDVISGGTGDDTIIGYGDGSLDTDVDVFEGGEGDDRLFGGTGSDTYHFARGDGRDSITDLGGADRIVLGAGIVATDLAVVQVGNDIELRVNNDGGRIRVIDALVGGSAIEMVAFADGTTWTWAEVVSRSLQATSGDDTLIAPATINGIGTLLDGKAGNDVLHGSAGADTLIGGTGNDRLEGGTGDDTYVFARGDGQDLILDNGGINTLSFATGILASDIRAVNGATNLVLEIIGTGDRIDLGTPAGAGMGVSRVTFEDGTIWTEATLIALARAATDGNDIIRGDASDNVLAGAAGDDLLIGNGGADILDGGLGHDRLEGGEGDDTYRFAATGGHDRISDTSGNDLLLFDNDITPADVTVSQSRDGADFTLVVRSTGAQVTIENALGSGKVETIRFADGTTWTTADLIARASSIGDDVLSGDTNANVMIGGLGNDHLSGRGGDDIYRFTRGDGSDVIDDDANSLSDRLEIAGYKAADVSFHRIGADSDDVAIRFQGTTDQIVIADALRTDGAGIETVVLDDGTKFSVADIRVAVLTSASTSGNDIILGTDAADTLAGGNGNDLIVGGAGSDTYLYARGDGDDRIAAMDGGADTLSLVDYNVADLVSAVRAGPDSNDLVLTFSTAGDRVILTDALGSDNGRNGNGVSIRFADGTVWTRDVMRARALADIDGSGNDNVYGFDGADNFAARPGNDLLAGASGDDVYRFGMGSGNDTIIDSGNSSADEIRILEFNSSEARVERLYRGSEAIVIRFTGNMTDSLTVFDALATDAKGIERYVFADGVSWTKATLHDLLENRAPVAVDDGFFSVTTGFELVIKATDLLRNDFDADSDGLSIVGVDAGSTGVATLDANGNIHYTATGGYYGAATLTYTIADGHNGFASAAIDLRVRPVAAAYPDGGFTVAEDGSLVIRVERLLANDLDGDRMVVGQVGEAKNGTVSLSSDGNITFTPNANFNGTAEFSYVANTPEGGRAEAKVTIQVTPVNDAPVARADTAAAVAEGTSFTLDPSVLLSNDTDIDGDRLTIRSVQSNADVMVSIGNDGLIHVSPRAYYWGNAGFDYVVADASGATATGRLTFVVTPVNDAPEAHDDRFETTDSGDPIREDNPIVIGPERLLANDIEHDGETMSVVAVGSSHGGQARLLDNGTVLFTPSTDFFGDAWFDYRVDDGHGGATWARATLVYQAVNDVPVARDDSYTSGALPILHGTEDHAIEIPIIELLKNDFDPEGFAVRFESASNAVHGDITVTDHGTIIFTPDADFWGEASFTYLVSDNEGAVDGATVSLWFDNVGDAPPVAHRDVIYVNEDVPTVIKLADLLANDVDIDRDPLAFLGWRPATSADVIKFGPDAGGRLNGTLEFDADGNLVFTPGRDASASSGFVYSVTDNADGASEGYVDIVIVPSNDDPTVGDDEGFVTPLDAPLVLRVTDLLKNDFDIEQADHDGDGVIDDDLDNPNRARPTFVGIEGVFDAAALTRGERILLGTADIVSWDGEQFIVVHFPAGFSGNVAVEYRIADADGATDTGFALATVADGYAGVLRGTAKADYLVGTAGTDLIQALGGNDFVLAGDGADRIETGLGDDRIDAGAGDDWIDSGDGADHISGGTGFDTVSYEQSDTAVRADLEARIGQGGFAQGDIFADVEALIGSEYADQLGGDAAANRLEGRAGNDILEGRAGNDTLLGGDGDDTLSGGADADVLDGGAGNDTADYSFGSVGVSISLVAGTAFGGDAEGDHLSNIENLTGTDANDVLEGDAGANILSGGRGDDSLNGGAGDDTLIGGRGADQLVGGEGTDIADYTMSAEAVTIDMIDGGAGGGDALGDTFSGIEIIQGSYHDDTIRGDDDDNRLRGGRGADILDGRGGFDIADYSRADEGVEVNLATGRGTAGEATGDQLTSIEMLVGSLWSDKFIGSAGDDRFEGLRGNDLIAGGGGSDTYLFGLDDGEDTIAENGAETDVDRLVLSPTIAPKDVSVLREGDDLLLEFERQDGFLVDTVRVTGHFLGRATGVEEVVFANGTVWTRDRIDELQRLGRFNAADDVVHFGREDEPIIIDPADLFANDATLDIGNLTLIGVDKPVHGSVRLTEDGKIEFLGAPNYNGDAFFNYTVRDQYGRESSARVEVNLSAVNDAPTAVDDALVYAVEDQVLRIRIDTLLGNDYDIDGEADLEGLHIVSIAPLTNTAGQVIDSFKDADHRFAGTNVTANISGDYLEFAIRPDYFGPAGFIYTLSDASGATSTARVEISVQPVNDAPRDRDSTHSIRLGQDTTITVADLLANTYDIEGDSFTFVGLHGGLDNNPANNGAVVYDAATGTITFTPAALGLASIDYDVIDARGAAATLTYDFKVRPLNDAPKAQNDYGLRTVEDQILVIDPATILANDTDENGDRLILDGIARFADGGKVRLRDDGMIEFRPTADYNGSAGFQYTISDGRGGTSSAYVAITVMPRNEGPILRNDYVTGFEDQPLFVIPAEAFGNDIEPDGDVLFFKRSTVLGVVDHRFLSADFTAEARLADGSALPSWLHFDAATMRFTGTPPAGTEPVAVDVWVNDPANGRVFNTRFELSSSDISRGYDTRAAVLQGFEIRSPFATDIEFGSGDVAVGTTVTASLADGSALPSWLVFDVATLRFAGTPPEGTVGPIGVRLTFSRPSQAGSEPLIFADAITLDPAKLPAGIAYGSDLAILDTKGGAVSATLVGGRPLPDWLTFDAATRTVAVSGFEPDADAQAARLQIVFTPPPRALPDGTYASTDRGFTLEFVLDPHGDLAAQTTAINQALEGNAFFAAAGLFALDLDGAASISATRESGAPLPEWLSFDPETLSFAGSPPPAWVGAIPVRIDIAAGNGRPAMSMITEVVVDDTFKIVTIGASTTLAKDRIGLNVPTNFDGTLVIGYDATDEKGGTSSKPALIFYDVKPTRERPDAAADTIATREGERVRFAVIDLLANDFDRDGDKLRIVELRQPTNGTLAVELAHVEIAPPSDLAPLDGAIWSAALADGSALPSWLAVDSATGVLSGDVPLALAATLNIRFTRTVGGTSQSATLTQHVDGNVGAYVIYTPIGSFSGDDGFTYLVTDDREGSSMGSAVVHVAPLNDPPSAIEDVVAALEDTPLVIDPQTLLANDFDVDGNAIRFIGVDNATHGTVSFDGTHILFTPDHNFSGSASFEYIVTDDIHGSSTGKVTVAIASTNRSPVANADAYEAVEDTPFEFTTANLLSNDTDIDGDAVTFQSISRNAAGGRIVELPNGRWQFVPDENVNGDVSFGYTVSDGRKTATGTITFHIAPVNDGPIANPDGAGTANDPLGVYVTKQNQALTIDFAALLANDRDVEGDSFEIVEIFDADQGAVTTVGSTVVFTPNVDYIGDAGFHYRVLDSRGASSVGYATLIVAPDVPLPVVVSDAGFEVLEDGFIDIDPAALMANDSTPEGSTLTFVGLDGAELLDNGKYRVTPAADFNGALVLRYWVKNEQDFAVSTTVTINVLPVADVPVARPDGLQTSEDTPIILFASQLLANDSDADKQAFVLTRIVAASGVTVTDLGFGQLQITPDANFNGSAWFDYEIEDSTGLTATARVDVSVSPVNDAPVVSVIPVLKGTEDQPFLATLPANFVSDTDGDALVVEVRGKNGVALPDWLAFDGETRTLSGKPPADFHGLIELEVAASDGLATSVRGLLVSIASVNDAPTLGQSIGTVEASEDQAFSIALPTDAFADVDGDHLSFTVTQADGKPLPTWLTFADGCLAGTPPTDFNGNIDLAIIASDGDLAVKAAFRLVVHAINDAPALVKPLADQTVNEDQAVNFILDKTAFGDVDGDVLSFTAHLADGADLPTWLTFDGDRFVGQPPANFNGVLRVEIIASDGSLDVRDTFLLNVTAQNDAPMLATSLPDVTSAEDTPLSFAIPADSFRDIDGDALTYTAQLADGTPLPSWLTFDGARFVGTPPASSVGTLQILVLASDGTLSASDTFSLTIEPVGGVPVVTKPLPDVTSQEDKALSFALPTGSFTDPDGDALAYSATLSDGAPLPPWLHFDGVRFTGTPPLNYNGVLDLKVTASDGRLAVSDVFRLTITPLNDAPTLAIALPDVASPEDAPVAIAIPAGAFTDVDGDVLIYRATLSNGAALPSWLKFDGAQFTGTPPANYTGSVDIRVTATDGKASVSDVFRLTVTPVNDAPVLAKALPDVTSAEDARVSFAIPTGSFSDIDGNALSYSATLVDGSPLPSWLTLTGTRFTGQPPANFNGSFDIRVVATDGSLTASDEFRLTITPVNDAPVIAKTLADVTSPEDTPVSIGIPDGSFADIDGDVLTYRATLSNGTALPSWLKFDGAQFTGTPPANYTGSVDIRVTATDGKASVSDVFRLTATPVNDAPVLAKALPDVTSAEDARVSFAIPTGSFSDIDGNVLSYSATLVDGSPLPSWLTLTGTRFTGQPPANFNGSFDIRVVATDGSLTASDEFRLTITPVNDAPTMAKALPDISSPEDTVVSFVIPEGSFTDIDGDVLTYTAKLTTGAALPTWLGFEGSKFTGTPPVNFNGSLNIRIVASDGKLSVSDDSRLTIVPVNDAPVVAKPLVDVVSPKDRYVSFGIPAGSFTDPEGSTLSYSATLTDGTALPSWLSFTGTAFKGQPPVNYNGALDLRITATDGSLSTSDDFRLTIGTVAVASAETLPISLESNILLSDSSASSDVGPTSLGASADTDRTLALMLQDMAAFGTQSGDGTLVASQTDQLRPMDFFA